MSAGTGRTDDTTQDIRARTSPEAYAAAGMIRRMAIKLTEGSFWRAVGALLLDRTQEARDAEVFGTLGFYSRPAAGANAEAILVNPTGGSNPVIVGTRDEDMRKLSPQLGQDSAMMRNRGAIVLITSDNHVEIRAANGAALKLPTLADFEALRNAFNAHLHVAPGGSTAIPTASGSPVIPVAAPAGTDVLKVQ